VEPVAVTSWAVARSEAVATPCCMRDSVTRTASACRSSANEAVRASVQATAARRTGPTAAERCWGSGTQDSADGCASPVGSAVPCSGPVRFGGPVPFGGPVCFGGPIPVRVCEEGPGSNAVRKSPPGPKTHTGRSLSTLQPAMPRGANAFRRTPMARPNKPAKWPRHLRRHRFFMSFHIGYSVSRLFG